MTDVHVSLPPALRRALELLADPPANPDVSKGYLDLLGNESADAVPSPVPCSLLCCYPEFCPATPPGFEKGRITQR